MRRILASGGLVVCALLLSAIPLYAYFRHSISIVNNTFSTGNISVRFFYDCLSPSAQTDISEDSYGPSNDFAIVECQLDGDGSDEQNQDDTNTVFALSYAAEHGAAYSVRQAGDIFNLEGDWTPSNGWWGGLSSAIDHTLIYPGWGHSPTHSSRDILSIGNSGNLPQDLYLTFQFEAFNDLEVQDGVQTEPLDGLYSNPTGGDQVDPYTDADWADRVAYETDLAKHIALVLKRVDNTGATVVGTESSGNLEAFHNVPHFLGSLQPNEVARVSLEWSWNVGDSGEDKSLYENLFFDYSMRFDAVQAGGTTPQVT